MPILAKPVTQICASAYNDFRANNHDQYINVIFIKETLNVKIRHYTSYMHVKILKK